jgi:hypothetical protein
MSQNPWLDTSETPSSKTTRLKPPLRAALASLEVQLDQELARYRRTRSGYKTPTQPRVGSFPSSQLQQLTLTNTVKNKTQQLSEVSSVDSTKPLESSTAHTEATTAPIESSVPKTKINTPASSVPETSPNSTSIVPAIVKKNNNSEALTELDKTDNPPDDYLESSEALLRSLVEEQPIAQKRNNSSDSLLSPLGIGSILLLLFASLFVGYVVFNPKSLSLFSLNGLFQQEVSNSTENTTVDGSDNNTASDPQLIPVPKYPNLATEEFPEIRDPNDVVGLKPSPSPIATPSPKPVAVPQSTNVTTTINQVQPKPPVKPPTSTATASPKPPVKPPTPTATASPKPLAQIQPSADGLYHVITDNKGDDALAAAQQIVPDAYLSENGQVIYLGALTNPEKAKQLIQELEAKGIKARIQQP